MNILLSSYSINPYKGSEDAVGWNWLLQLSKNFNNKNDKIYVITKKYNEKATVKGIEEAGLRNVELIITDVPHYLNWFREKHSIFHHMYYILWQKEAYKWVKKCNIKFDIVHHVTMGDFRITGKMFKLKDAYTIFGPVGGGQSTPSNLKCYETNKNHEKFREIINRLTTVNPFYKRRIKKFNNVFAVNPETEKILSKVSGKNVSLLFDAGVLEKNKNLTINKQNNEIPKIIYVGRLIGKKGVMFLIDVIKVLPQNTKFVMSLYGEGPLKDSLNKKIKDYNLSDRVKIEGQIPYDKISTVYQNADIFVLPSLRETGGTVLVEAMAHSLPICSLDMSFSHILKEKECGIFTNVNQSRENIINEFANNLLTLINQQDLRLNLGKNGYKYANSELTWDNKFKTVYKKWIKNE